MFFGVKKSGRLYRAFYRMPHTHDNAAMLTFKAWFLLRDASVDVIISYSALLATGYTVVAKGYAAGYGKFVGFHHFCKTWYGCPIRKVDSKNDTDLLADKGSYATYEAREDLKNEIPFGALVAIRGGLLAGQL